ncbi:3-ketoacyl-ACP reductase [Pseudoroseicyclus sp. H15]
MENASLHARMQALGHKLQAAEERLRKEAHLHQDSTHLTAKELRERYRHLQARLNSEAAEEEAHGHHVGDLERSVQLWLDSIDTSHVSSN